MGTVHSSYYDGAAIVTRSSTAQQLESTWLLRLPTELVYGPLSSELYKRISHSKLVAFVLVRIRIRGFPARNQEGEFLSNLVRILVEFETLAASLAIGQP